MLFQSMSPQKHSGGFVILIFCSQHSLESSHPFQMPSAPSNAISEGRADTKRVGGICNAIHEAQQNKKVLMLRFVKEKGHLSHDPVYATAMNIDIEPSTVISLDSFIAANGLLLPRQCLHIATTLATSLVQFNATKWLNRVWTKRAIH